MNKTKYKTTISHELLIENGYRNYAAGEYQKKVIDDNNKVKYFINIQQLLLGGMYLWWPSVQFDILENNQSISISLIQWLNDSGRYTGITLAEVEEYIENVWVKLNGKYYDE